MTKREPANPTVEGDQPERASRKQQIEVPVGLEQLLYLAARDEELKAELLSDRDGTLKRLDVRLSPTEINIVQSVSEAELNAIIERIRPDSPNGPKLMDLIAASTRAAGPPVISYNEETAPVPAGIRPEIFSGPPAKPPTGAGGGSESDEDNGDIQ